MTMSTARASEPGVPGVTAASAVMRQVIGLAIRAGESDAKVLITGESGVGKDLIARTIHLHSRRASGPFVPVNCAGLTETLLESELFGHVKGSFTGAYRDKPGRVVAAHNGTLFLDEIGETSLRMQALLLRFLENGEIQAVGADTVSQGADVRVVAATNRNLNDLVAAGSFREDLLYRLRVIHLHVPPLRERREDVPGLIEFFAARIDRGARFTPDALNLLGEYRWPGNVRELQNVVEQALWLAGGAAVGVEHLPAQVQQAGHNMLPMRERRRTVADDLYQALVDGSYSFWDHVYPLFLSRDITRHDMRSLVHLGLACTRGNYRALLRHFGIPQQDYKRFLNFLAAHECSVDVRAFREGAPDPIRPRRVLVPVNHESTKAPSAP